MLGPRWSRGSEAGGSRLDLDLDGEIDHPGAAIMDRAWPKIADAFMEPQLGRSSTSCDRCSSRFDLPPSGQYSGWHQYFDRDVRELLGQKVEQAVQERLLRPRRPERRARTTSGPRSTQPVDEFDRRAGAPTRTAWRSDAVRERITLRAGTPPDDDALHEPPERASSR